MYKLRFYGLLIGFSITIMMICDTLAFKVVHILSYDFAASGLIYSLNFSLSAVITEVYGFRLAGRMIWIQLVCHIIFILSINLLVILPSPEDSVTYKMYFNLYGSFWRVLLGSCIAMPTAYFINDIIMSKLKINLYGRKFIYRFFISSFVGSAILVLISYPINFYHQYSIAHILIIGFNTWLYKIFASILLLPIAIILIDKLKDFEKLDYYDYGISYSPLKVFSVEDNKRGINEYGKKERNNKNYSNDRYSSL